MEPSITAAPQTVASPSRAVADAAARDFLARIRASQIVDSLASMACDLCLNQTDVDEAVQQIQHRAMERILLLLDTSVLSNEAATASCLNLLEHESERIAWLALEKATDALTESLFSLEPPPAFPN